MLAKDSLQNHNNNIEIYNLALDNNARINIFPFFYFSNQKMQT